MKNSHSICNLFFSILRLIIRFLFNAANYECKEWIIQLNNKTDEFLKIDK